MPPGRAVRLNLAWSAPEAAWGATWSFACGAAAAWPWQLAGGGWSHLVVAWFVAVPLLGSLFLITWYGPPNLLVPVDVDQPTRVSGGRVRRRSSRRRLTPEAGQLGVLAIVGLALGTALSPSTVWVVVAAGVGLAIAWAVRRTWPGVNGVARSAFDVALPALVGWVALGGVAAVPAPVGMTQGALAAARVWGVQNWSFPVLAVAFMGIHHASTAAHHLGEIAARRRELILAYAAAIAALALTGKAWPTGCVAALFVLQWPFLAYFGTGAVRWHFMATQWFAMLAFLVAALAV